VHDESPDLRTRFITDIEAVVPIWRELEGAVPHRPLATGWDWTATWVEHFGDVVPHEFLVVEDASGPAGIALVTADVLRRGALRVRRLHLGTAGEPPGESVYVERNAVLARPGRADVVAAAILRTLERERRWDALLLDGFVPEHAASFRGVPGPRWLDDAQVAMVADLATTPEHGPAAPFGTGVRREWRRAVRLAGPFEVEWAEDPTRALEILDELIGLHQRRWEAVGQPGAFAAERVCAFHRSLVPRLLARDAVAVTRVTGAQGLLGCRYDLVDGDRLLSYQAGWQPGSDPRVSVGVALDLACMGAAAERGLRCWDHLPEPQRHKRRLSTGSYELHWLTRRRGRVRWVLLDAGRRARRALRGRAP
jgi:CelD/BcsL family acetyltransferase involved in cellulose biosynthesis